MVDHFFDPYLFTNSIIFSSSCLWCNEISHLYSVTIYKRALWRWNCKAFWQCRKQLTSLDHGPLKSSGFKTFCHLCRHCTSVRSLKHSAAYYTISRMKKLSLQWNYLYFKIQWLRKLHFVYQGKKITYIWILFRASSSWLFKFIRSSGKREIINGCESIKVMKWEQATFTRVLSCFILPILFQLFPL